jgi:hypothetical protein
MTGFERRAEEGVRMGELVRELRTRVDLPGGVFADG